MSHNRPSQPIAILIAAIVLQSMPGDRSRLLASPLVEAQSTAIVPIYGVDFSPYVNGQNPNNTPAPQISAAQIQSRMAIVAPYVQWVRSFSSTNGLENIPAAARALGLHVAAGAWISSDTAQNTLEINNLIAAANAGLVDIAIVGSEAILRNDVTVSQLIAYMNQVRQAVPASVKVTTADVYGTFLANPSLVAASDVVFANFYPYWEGTAIGNAACSLQQEYQQMQSAAGGKQVWISETGWPSAGDSVGAAVPSPASAALYALQVFTWAGANNIPLLYFEAFDENWKASTPEGPQGAHWGIFDANGDMKTGMDAYFNGETAATDCNGQLAGPVAVTAIYVPPYGSSDELEVQVTGVQPANYQLATYIQVFGGWWTKPTFADPTVAINPDGTARIVIVSGGSDQDATNITVDLIPSSVTPPQAGGGGLPTIAGTVATLQIARTQTSISGTIADTQGHPIGGAAVSEPVLGTAVSGPDGKYSFYNIASSGTATLTVTATNYTFASSPATVAILSGNQPVNFTGTPLPSIPFTNLPAATTGAKYSVTLNGAGGQPPYNNWTVNSGSLPPGLALNSGTGQISGTPSSTNGSPFQFSVTMTDNSGLPASPTALSITVLVGMSTTTQLKSSVNPSALGQKTVLTATVTPAPQGGTVAFYDGATPLGSAGVTAGQASFSTFLLPAGLRALRAVYGGDVTHLASAATLSQTVRSRPAAGFGTLASYPVGNGAWSVTVADFNGDGNADLATANQNGSVSVLLGNGDGTFQTAANYPAGTTAWAIASGDLNGDGIPDLVTANYGGANVSVLLGNGDGTFQPAVSYPAGPSPQHILLADFNGDFKLDVVVVNSAGDEINVLLGNGDGTLAGPLTTTVGSYPSGIAAGDFDGDGITDLAVTNSQDHNVSILLGNGDGTFQAPANYNVGKSPAGIVAGDLDGDGNTDLAIANQDDATVSILHGDGRGKFQLSGTYPTAIIPDVLAAGDFDGDGQLDLIAATTQEIGVCLGNGDGTFQPAILFPVDSQVAAIAAADFNGDGRTDLVLPGYAYPLNTYAANVLPGAPSKLTISSAHTGSFLQGQAAATYSVTVGNSATVSSIGAVTVVESPPAGLSLQSMKGSGWTCPSGGAACTRNDALASGASYPAIAVTVSVAGDAPASITNAVSVSGGGSDPASAADVTAVAAPSPCDVNIDGVTDASDVQAVVNQALGIAPAQNDLSVGGVTNVVAVQTVINMVLRLGCS